MKIVIISTRTLSRCNSMTVNTIVGRLVDDNIYSYEFVEFKRVYHKSVLEHSLVTDQFDMPLFFYSDFSTRSFIAGRNEFKGLKKFAFKSRRYTTVVLSANLDGRHVHDGKRAFNTRSRHIRIIYAYNVVRYYDNRWGHVHL